MHWSTATVVYCTGQVTHQHQSLRAGFSIRIHHPEDTESAEAELKVQQEMDDFNVSAFQDMLKELGFDTDSNNIVD